MSDPDCGEDIGPVPDPTGLGGAVLVDEDLLDAVVVSTGPYAYRRPDRIAVVPAALLGP